MKAALPLLLAASLLAGCAQDAPSTPAAADPSPASTQAAAPAAEGNATAEAPPAPRNVTVYFTSQGGFAAAPPASETTVTLDTPANTPATGASPEWTGKGIPGLPAKGTVTLHAYVTSSSATVAAATVGMPYPHFEAWVTTGTKTTTATATGPAFVTRGQVEEIRVQVPLDNPGGAGDLRVELAAYYSHFAAAGEFQLVLGPQHPMRLEIVAS